MSYILYKYSNSIPSVLTVEVVSHAPRDPARALQDGVCPDDPPLCVEVEQLSAPFPPIPTYPPPLAVETLPTVPDVIEDILSCCIHPPSVLPLDPPDCVD